MITDSHLAAKLAGLPIITFARGPESLARIYEGFSFFNQVMIDSEMCHAFVEDIAAAPGKWTVGPHTVFIVEFDSVCKFEWPGSGQGIIIDGKLLSLADYTWRRAGFV